MTELDQWKVRGKNHFFFGQLPSHKDSPNFDILLHYYTVVGTILFMSTIFRDTRGVQEHDLSLLSPSSPEPVAEVESVKKLTQWAHET